VSSTALYRLSGLTLLLGAVLGTIGNILTDVLYSGNDPRQYLTPLWLVVTLVTLIGELLLVLGLSGIVVRQARRAGWLGLAGCPPSPCSRQGGDRMDGFFRLLARGGRDDTRVLTALRERQVPRCFSFARARFRGKFHDTVTALCKGPSCLVKAYSHLSRGREADSRNEFLASLSGGETRCLSWWMSLPTNRLFQIA
jgi:hypothetical protein